MESARRRRGPLLLELHFITPTPHTRDLRLRYPLSYWSPDPLLADIKDRPPRYLPGAGVIGLHQVRPLRWRCRSGPWRRFLDYAVQQQQREDTEQSQQEVHEYV